MSITSAIKKMVAKGLTYEQALIAAEVFEEEVPARSAGAIRQERYRRNVASQSVTRDAGDASSPDKEVPPAPPEEINPNYPPIVPPLRERFANPSIILQAETDPVTAKAFADHCQQRKPRLTAQSAEGMVRVLRAVREQGGDPTAALQLAMQRGWATFDVDWLRNAGFSFSKPRADAIDWGGWVEGFYADGVWQDRLGPRPDEAGCKAPAELLRKFASVGDRDGEAAA